MDTEERHGGGDFVALSERQRFGTQRPARGVRAARRNQTHGTRPWAAFRHHIAPAVARKGRFTHPEKLKSASVRPMAFMASSGDDMVPDFSSNCSSRDFADGLKRLPPSLHFLLRSRERIGADQPLPGSKSGESVSFSVSILRCDRNSVVLLRS